MSPQSIWSDKAYIQFKKYSDKLDKNYRSMPKGDLDEAIENWKRGAEKMRGIAVGYGMKSFKLPMPNFMISANEDSIVWVRSKIGDEEITYGLWDSTDDHIKIEDKHVFSERYLDFILGDYVNKDKAKKKLMELVVAFNGKELVG